MTATQQLPPLPLPAASYARISDNDGAGAGVGTGDQHRRNGKRAQADRIPVAYELTDDDRSAYSEKVVRDDYERLLNLIKTGEIGYVLVKHADRLHRRTDQAEQFLRLARTHGTVVITASGFRFHFDGAEGRKAFRAAAVDASYESEHRGERIADSHERRAFEGDYRGGSRRPFGWGVPTGVYRRVRDKKTGKNRDVEIMDMSQHNPTEAAEIRRWKRSLLSGVEPPQVMRSIKVPTVTGNPHWSKRSFQQVLTNPRTSGHSVYNGEIVKRNAWDAILTDDERDALRALFADPKRKVSPGNQPKWLGSVIYRCGVCNDGTVMTCRYKNGRRVYRCQLTGHCQNPADPIDEYVEKVIIKRLSRDDLADLISSGPDINVAQLREQSAVLTQRKTDAALQFAQGTIDAAQLATITDTLNQQISTITAQLTDAAGESPLLPFLGNDARTVWADTDTGHRREVLRNLFTITIRPPGRGRRTIPRHERAIITDPR